eukprot:CAMPEP_0168522524 /NCGR_PEP_ID=MMETSP0405-20121227/9399_1 /TAXON_ID=498012 /ORGANISM="Trichosphaerium sp, Strain Am-I-7 wt" /LENGTH=289 /DNA_ID=CAMNT_0008544143 /DNA_START=30 /DNA_END=899 /DNA_ORIENTATION=+
MPRRRSQSLAPDIDVISFKHFNDLTQSDTDVTEVNGKRQFATTDKLPILTNSRFAKDYPARMARSHEPPKGTWMPNSPDKPSAMKQLQSLSIFDQFPSWEVQTKAPKKASLVCKDLVQFNFEWGTSPLRLIEQFTMKPKCTDLQQRNFTHALLNGAEITQLFDNITSVEEFISAMEDATKLVNSVLDLIDEVALLETEYDVFAKGRGGPSKAMLKVCFKSKTKLNNTFVIVFNIVHNYPETPMEVLVMTRWDCEIPQDTISATIRDVNRERGRLSRICQSLNDLCQNAV